MAFVRVSVCLPVTTGEEMEIALFHLSVHLCVCFSEREGYIHIVFSCVFCSVP